MLDYISCDVTWLTRLGILEEILEEACINLNSSGDTIILSEYVTTPLQASLA